MVNAKEWCGRSLMAVSSLWNEEAGNHHAWRFSGSKSSRQAPGANWQAEEYFPTATFHAIAAFEDCGAWASRDSYNKQKRTLATPELEVQNIINFSTYDDVLDTLVTRVPEGAPLPLPPPLPGEWVEAVLGASSHSVQKEDGAAPTARDADRSSSKSRPRQSIVLGHLFQALRILVSHAVREKGELNDLLKSGKGVDSKKRDKCEKIITRLDQLLSRVRAGFPQATEYLCDAVRRGDIGATHRDTTAPVPPGPFEVATASELSESPHISPFVLLMVAVGVVERDAVLRKLSLDSATLTACDFVKPAELCSRLKKGNDPLSKYLRSQFSKPTLKSLEAYQPKSQPSDKLLSDLADDLRQVLAGGPLYDEGRFSLLNLSDEARALLKQGPQGEELLLLNRMLLEEAYPGEIAPGLALYRESIEGESEFSETPKKMAREIRRLKEVMGQYFTHEVDRLMSRRQIPLYPHYDAASLAFSMHGRVLMDESFRRSPLFRACVQAIVDDQNQDGTWPVGRSATFDDTGTAIQQPSIAVALSLAECIFRPELLRGNRSDEVEVLKIGLEALRKIAQYLALSFTSARRGDGKECYGWVSDRVRWPHVSETWITAMATRVFHILWLAERVCARDEMLSKYGVRGEAGARDGARAQNKVPGSAARKVNLLAAWAAEVVDPDIHAKPGDALVRKVLTPLQKQLDEGVNFIRPAEDGVSFIIFGPPGSGKTFFVETFAKIVGWPLVTLNPGHFIRRGLELIEATSSEIFSDLLNLDHAVVFFDECDELFRTRQDGAAASRNILSFATASMLPKLQALHDARRVIFFLGTNYLQNVDDAIRRQGRFDDTLFFDRPDDTARAELIKKIWRAKKGEAEQLEVSELQWGVEYTTGWMIKEVINYAKALAAGEPPPKPPNIDDYLDWCLAERKDQPPVGEQELTASRLGPAAKEDILKRWKKVKEYDDAREK